MQARNNSDAQATGDDFEKKVMGEAAVPVIVDFYAKFAMYMRLFLNSTQLVWAVQGSCADTGEGG